VQSKKTHAECKLVEIKANAFPRSGRNNTDNPRIDSALTKNEEVTSNI